MWWAVILQEVVSQELGIGAIKVQWAVILPEVVCQELTISKIKE